VPQVQVLVRQLEPSAAVDRVEPLTKAVASSLSQPRFAAIVVSGFAGLAMLLAAVGLYGVMSHGVAQRRRELGIRAALGAGRLDLVRLVLREGLSMTLVGLVLGVFAAGLLTRLMQDLLFGITPMDAMTFTGASAILMGTAICACLGPALRAASIDPAVTLRD